MSEVVKNSMVFTLLSSWAVLGVCECREQTGSLRSLSRLFGVALLDLCCVNLAHDEEQQRSTFSAQSGLRRKAYGTSSGLAFVRLFGGRNSWQGAFGP